ncbi:MULTISPECIES: FAD-binding oxidoreductase [unclassified Tatumella]|uniref:NAD(P)/FAD-dependent oxidoreductase n=1 Tax=unclassified Tatumella TaxID=2649542 RepID=UPI001BB08BEA|nr:MULTISPECIES: FAD-binding oxidoreductase [unclassified Tatumella]MBS0876351.1 FAD-binding oxidoreductase [Tatumella sp. JGM82]MBS0889524.1 FAD-binding oxidoreductase [Tatumella sp. JGM94]MBS0900646.1 FAD-binding oxidoreductase [Tatumella sp. JGM100]
MDIKNQFSKPQLINDAKTLPASDISINGDWNWVRQQEDTLKFDPGIAANYYESTLAPWMSFPPLETDKQCELVVIGGGLLGASTALHLAEAGIDTVLLEKNTVGSGASGRNGGQLTPGLARWEAESMLEHLPEDEARRLWRFTSAEAMSLIDDIASRYQLQLDRQYGHLTAAVHPGHMNALVQAADARKFLGDSQVTVLGNYQLQEHIHSDIYYGGVLDECGGQIHSLALNRGLIYGFMHNGGCVHEHSEVIKIEETPAGTRVHTASGVITATRGVVIAVHDATHALLNQNNATTLPFYTYVGVTSPIDGGHQTLLPTGKPVYDTQLQIDYYRPVRNQRLLFGGQGTGMRWDNNRTVDYLTSRLRTVFPQREDIELDFAWSGTTDLTLNGATDCRKSGLNSQIYSVHGWSGHGVAQTVRIGKAITDDITGRNDDFRMLTSIKHTSLLLGRQLAPVAIPLAKTLLGISAKLTPGKMISF